MAFKGLIIQDCISSNIHNIFLHASVNSLLNAAAASEPEASKQVSSGAFFKSFFSTLHCGQRLIQIQNAVTRTTQRQNNIYKYNTLTNALSIMCIFSFGLSCANRYIQQVVASFKHVCRMASNLHSVIYCILTGLSMSPQWTILITNNKCVKNVLIRSVIIVSMPDYLTKY